MKRTSRTALAEPLPVLVIAEMLGIPIERRPDFKRWSDAVVGVLSGNADIDAGQASMLEMVDFFTQIATERQRQPKDDLISVLVAGSEDGRLEPMEIVVFAILLLIAGNETTTNLLTNLLTALWVFPDVDSEAPSRPEPGPRSRRRSTALRRAGAGTAPRTRVPVEVAGTQVPADSLVMILFGSTNRDTRTFENAAAFRLDRTNNQHLGFGTGIHLCLGAALARLEARVALDELLARTRSIQPRGPATRVDSFILRARPPPRHPRCRLTRGYPSGVRRYTVGVSYTVERARTGSCCVQVSHLRALASHHRGY